MGICEPTGSQGYTQEQKALPGLHSGTEAFSGMNWEQSLSLDWTWNLRTSLVPDVGTGALSGLDVGTGVLSVLESGSEALTGAHEGTAAFLGLDVFSLGQALWLALAPWRSSAVSPHTDIAHQSWLLGLSVIGGIELWLCTER